MVDKFQTPGQSGNRDKTGMTTFVIPYFCKNLKDVVNVGRGLNPLGLQETNRQWQDFESAGFEVTVTYGGVPAGGGGDGDQAPGTGGGQDVQYSFDSSFAEEKIESHPELKKILAKYEGTYVEDKDKYVFSPTLSKTAASGLKKGAKGGDRNPALGLESYLVFQSVFRMTYTRTELPRGLLSKVGKVVDKLPGGYPTPLDRNWLIMPPKVTQHGNAFQIQEEWILSPPGGPWLPEVYEQATE